MGLYEKLRDYGDSDAYPMHMPGHKRNRELLPTENPYAWDITEIDGFDDLHEPEGILKEGMERAARLWGAEESFYLINGSTAGILAGISACVRPGDRILMARNCHKSVYHSVVLNQLEPTYLHPAADPETGILAGIEPMDVERALTEAESGSHGKQTADYGSGSKAKQTADYGSGSAARPYSLVVITSPTYEGILSDVQMIARICHRHGVPLLVDEAHGAHLSSGRLYTSCFPEGAVACGADLVIQSLHKTLPALTQTGLIHRQGTLVSGADLRYFLHIYQTSSPSYVLMAAIDRCIRLMEEQGRQMQGAWAERLRLAYRRMSGLKILKLLTADSSERFFAWDPSKLVILTGDSGHTGRELMDLLRERYRLEMEMASDHYIIAMTGAGDTEEGIRRFADAICAIDEAWAEEKSRREDSGRRGDFNRREDSDSRDDFNRREDSDSRGDFNRREDSDSQDDFNRWEDSDSQDDFNRRDNSDRQDEPRNPLHGGMPEGGVWDHWQEKTVLPPWKLRGAETEAVPLDEQALGRVSAEFVFAYPPGIPVLAPGEEVTRTALRVISIYEKSGIPMRGYEDQAGHRIRVAVRKQRN